MDPIQPIYSWNVNGYEVRVFQEQDYLEYETVDIKSGKIFFKGFVNFKGVTLEEMLSRFKNCRVMIEDNGSAKFLQRYHTWDLNNYEVNLIKGTNDLIWDVFSNLTQITSFISFRESISPSARCHPETVAIINEIKNECFKDSSQIVRLVDKVIFENEGKKWKANSFNKQLNDYIQNSFDKNRDWMLYNSWATSATVLWASGGALSTSLTAYLGTGVIGSSASLVSLLALSQFAMVGGLLIPLAYVGYNTSKGADELFDELINNERKINDCQKTPNLIEIEPKLTAPSSFDPRIIVCKFTWAVTLITGPKGDSGNHAAIIVEGLDNAYFNGVNTNQEYFIYKSEFNPPIRARIYDKKKFQRDLLIGIQKSETWMISSEKVEVMLNSIEQEKQLQQDMLNDGEIIKIDYKGNESILGKGHHNCFTWAREKLKMLNIDMPKIKFGPPDMLLTLPKCYTHTIEEGLKRELTVQQI